MTQARFPGYRGLSEWAPQGFVVSYEDMGPVGDLCRIVERDTGKVIAYVPVREDDPIVRINGIAQHSIVGRVCAKGGLLT